MLKHALTVSMLTLLLISCGGSNVVRYQPIPRPELESATKNDQGGVCIDQQDMAELLHYIDALETAHGQAENPN